MITKNDAATAGQSVSVEDDSLRLAAPATVNRRVRPVLWRLGSANVSLKP